MFVCAAQINRSVSFLFWCVSGGRRQLAQRFFSEIITWPVMPMVHIFFKIQVCNCNTWFHSLCKALNQQCLVLVHAYSELCCLYMCGLSGPLTSSHLKRSKYILLVLEINFKLPFQPSDNPIIYIVQWCPRRAFFYRRDYLFCLGICFLILFYFWCCCLHTLWVLKSPEHHCSHTYTRGLSILFSPCVSQYVLVLTAFLVTDVKCGKIHLR